ncbi:hypothetical protein BDD12DRAFT_840210 [Trichophaea hybrida]|nr:hypothetical protein BDD12DRAFT_840210 [Trichophaea hybrida]
MGKHDGAASALQVMAQIHKNQGDNKTAHEYYSRSLTAIEIAVGGVGVTLGQDRMARTSEDHKRHDVVLGYYSGTGCVRECWR